MQQGIFTIRENRRIADAIYRMAISGDVRAITAPGQFVNIHIDGFYLRRPISVCDIDDGQLILIYKVVGQGTEKMSRMVGGEQLDLLSGLGNGFDMSLSGPSPLLIGGGVGTPPLYYLAKQLLAKGVQPLVALGFAGQGDSMLINEFRALGVEIAVATIDGSLGSKGFVTTPAATLAAKASYIYTCGPQPMLKAVYDRIDLPGQFSFEERMGCGFGACMGCTCQTKYGAKRICLDGPVLERGEIVW